MGWRARLQAAKEILWGRWWFRIALGVWFLVSGYDTFSGAISQVIPDHELIPLGSLVMGGSHLLPWWGWLLVLYGMLSLALFEYVVRQFEVLRAAQALLAAEPEAPPLAPAPPTPATRPLDPAVVRKIAETLLAANRAKILRDWSRVTSMELFQAACLWAEELPPRVSLLPISEAAQANLEMLRAAVMDGYVERVKGTIDPLEKFGGPRVPDTSRVTRDSLVRFANERGERPAFLFPPSPPAATPSLPSPSGTGPETQQ